jgi:hypothetical protein
MEKAILYITMLLFAVLLSVVATFGKDWIIMLVASLAGLVLIWMGLFTKDK